MTVTTLEPATIECLDFQPGCQGRSIFMHGSWDHYECHSNAEVVRFKKCGCIALHCMSCRNYIKRAVESWIAAGRNHFCSLCGADFLDVKSYWDMTIREVPL